MARLAVAQHVMEIHKFTSQGVGKRFEDIFDREKAPGQPRAAVKQESVQVEQQHEQQQNTNNNSSNNVRLFHN